MQSKWTMDGRSVLYLYSHRIGTATLVMGFCLLDRTPQALCDNNNNSTVLTRSKRTCFYAWLHSISYGYLNTFPSLPLPVKRSFFGRNQCAVNGIWFIEECLHYFPPNSECTSPPTSTSRIEQSWSYCTQTLLVLLRVRWCGNKPSLLLLHAGTEIKATLFADRGWQVKHKTSTKVLLLLLVLLDVCATTTVYSHRHPVNSVSNLLPNSH